MDKSRVCSKNADLPKEEELVKVLKKYRYQKLNDEDCQMWRNRIVVIAREYPAPLYQRKSFIFILIKQNIFLKTEHIDDDMDGL